MRADRVFTVVVMTTPVAVLSGKRWLANMDTRFGAATMLKARVRAAPVSDLAH